MSTARAPKRPPAKPAPAKARQVLRSSARAAPEKNTKEVKNRTDKWIPPRAGMGRPKGSANLVTRSVREVVQALVEDNAPKAQEHLDRVGRKNSAKWLSLYAKLMEFVVPKLQRTEISGELNHNLPYSGEVSKVVGAVEAARVYQEMMGVGGRDPRSVTFVDAPTPPLPKPAAAPIPSPAAAIAPRPKPTQEYLAAPEPAGRCDDVPSMRVSADREEIIEVVVPSPEQVAADLALARQRAPRVVT